jgi:uncharacterized protein YdhG (YjbR/CyaY superfamily)
MPAKSTPEKYIAAAPAAQRDILRALHDTVRSAAPRLETVVTPTMLGYGPFHYRYESGREGDTFLISVAARKAGVSLYVFAAKHGQYLPEWYKDKLPKASIGKSCIRIKRIEDVDRTVLRALVREAVKVGGVAAV